MRKHFVPNNRVRDTQRAREGVVLRAMRLKDRYVYMVRWDGFEHESGPYGVRSLRRIGRVRSGETQECES